MPRGSDASLRLSYNLAPEAPKELREHAMKEIASAMLRHGGNVSGTAKWLGVGRATLHRWIAENPRLARYLESARRRGPE